MHPIVLILGAGANAPFGLPLANELRERLLSLTIPSTSVPNLLSVFSQHEIREFHNALLESPFKTIDEFLEVKKSQRRIAAHLTAYIILNEERLSAISREMVKLTAQLNAQFSPKYNYPQITAPLKGNGLFPENDWYAYFFNAFEVLPKS